MEKRAESSFFLFFFQIHFNQQELATNIITGILIPLGNLYPAEELHFSCIGDHDIVWKQLLTSYQTIKLHCGCADSIIKLVMVRQ